MVGWQVSPQDPVATTQCWNYKHAMSCTGTGHLNLGPYACQQALFPLSPLSSPQIPFLITCKGPCCDSGFRYTNVYLSSCLWCHRSEWMAAVDLNQNNTKYLEILHATKGIFVSILGTSHIISLNSFIPQIP